MVASQWALGIFIEGRTIIRIRREAMIIASVAGRTRDDTLLKTATVYIQAGPASDRLIGSPPCLQAVTLPIPVIP